MNKELISDKQGIYITILCIIGTSTIIVMGLEAKQDVWLANILSILMALPLVIIYARLHHIFPGKDLFDILHICFGKFMGKIISILYIWFAFHTGSLIVSDFGHFITISSLSDTPKIAPIICIMILGTMGVKKGIEVLGKWSEFFAPIIIIFIFATILLSIPNMNIDNIKPILYDGIEPVMQGAIDSFSFPFAETILLTMFFCDFEKKKSSYRIYLIGLMVGGIILVISNLTYILVLGVNSTLSLYYPAYEIASRINVGDLIERLEMISAIIFLLGGFIKMSICLLSVCKGVSKLAGCNDYRFIVTPIAILMLILSYSVYHSVMEIVEFASTVSPYYKFPFEVILPIITWIILETKKKFYANT